MPSSKRRRCGECKKLLPADAHWNRRFCLTCRKQRDRRHKRLPPAVRRPGTQTLCTEARIAKLEYAASLGGYQRTCAGSVGISARALERWLQRGYDAMVEAGIDPDEPPDDAEELVKGTERIFVRLRRRFMRAREKGALVLLQSLNKCGVGGPVYAPDPNAPKPEEYEEIVQTLAAAGRSDLIPVLRRPEQKQVGFVEPDARAAAKALALSHGYTEKQQVELSGKVEGTAAPSLMIFYPPEDTDDD